MILERANGIAATLPARRDAALLFGACGAAIALGVAVAVSLELVLLALILAAAVGAFYRVVSAVSIGQLRPVDALVAFLVIWLPLTPYLLLHQYGTVVPVSRYVPALAVLVAMAAGAIRVDPTIARRGGWLLLAFATYQLVPITAAGFTSDALLRAANWVMFMPLAFVAFDARSRRVLVAALVFAAAVLSVGLVLQWRGALSGVTGGIQIGGGLLHPQYQRRYSSFLQEPNAFGLYMVAALLVFFAVSVNAQSRRSTRLLAAGGIAVCIVAVFASVSRAALIAIPIALAFQAFSGHWRYVAKLVSTVAVIGAVLFLTIPSTQSGFTSGLRAVTSLASGADKSVQVRRQLLATRLAGASNVVYGAGYGGYAGAVDPRAIGHRHLELRLQGVDNAWLKLWLEEGVIGVALLAMFLLVAIYRAVVDGRRTNARLMGAVVGAILVVVVFRSFSNDIFDVNPWNCFTWIVVGYAFSIGSTAKERQTSVAPRVDPATS